MYESACEPTMESAAFHQLCQDVRMHRGRAAWRLLGEVGVDLDGEPALLKGHRHRAVVGYLLLHANRPVATERLVDAIWGDRPPKTAKNTLQRFIADIRRSLGPFADRLATVPGGYQLHVDDADLDVAVIDRAIARARSIDRDPDPISARNAWSDVVELWTDRPLSGIGRTDYGEPARARLVEIRNDAIENFIACELDVGRHEAISSMVEDFAAEHPTRDRAWELLMLARYRSGRQADALAAFDTLRRRLVDDLGVDPSPAIRRLHLSILEHEVMPPAHASVHSVAAGADRRSEPRAVAQREQFPLPAHLDVGAAVPFAGRRSEVAHIGQALRTEADRASVYFVSGEPGMGKTRSAAEVATEAHARGVNVVYGRCMSDVAGDYQPWRAILGQALRAAPHQILRRHIERFGPVLFALANIDLADRDRDLGDLNLNLNLTPRLVDAESGEEGVVEELVVGATFDDQDAIIRAAVSLLEDLAETTPVLVVLDDLQWTDTATLRLVSLVADTSAASVVILGLYRSDEVGSDHVVTEHIAAAPSDRAMAVIDLHGLDEDSTRQLVAATIGAAPGAVDDEVVRSVHGVTSGNPFFVIETVRSLSDDNRLEEFTQNTDLDVPSSISRLVLRRVGRLGAAAADTLRLASVFGREFDLDVLAAALGRDEFEVLDDVEAALRARLVDDAPEGRDRFAFAHDLVHQSLAADQSESRRCRSHGAIADAMEKQYASRLDQHVEEIATQLLAANNADDVERTFAYCRRAGTAAAARFAPDDSIRWFERALDLLDRSGTDDLSLRADVMVQLGAAEKVAVAGGRSSTLIEAGRLALASGNDTALVASVIENRDGFNTAGWTLDQGRIDMARAALDAVGDDDSLNRARVLSALCSAMWEVEHAAEVRPLYEQLIALVRRLDDPLMLVTTLEVSIAARNYRPSRRDLASYAVELRSLYPNVPLGPNQLIGVLSALATTALQLADRELLEHALAVLDDTAERTGLPSAVNARFRTDAMRSWIAGDIGAYERFITDGFRYSSQFEGSDVATLVFRGQMFFAMWAQGREGELVDVDVLVPGRPATRPLYRVIQALAHIAAGQSDGAHAILNAELAAGFWPNDNHWTMQSTTMWADPAVQLGRRDICNAVIENLAPSTGSIAGQFMSPFEPVDTALGRMCVVVDRFDEAEEYFARASAITDRFDAGWMAARVDLGRLELALARSDAGDVEQAALLTKQIRAVATERGYGSISRRLDDLATR